MLSKVNQRMTLDKKFALLNKNLINLPAYGWVNQLRYLCDVSQQDLARLIGVTQKAVDKLESNEVNGVIQLSTLRQIAEVFGSDLYYAMIPRNNLENIRTALIWQCNYKKLGDEKAADFATQQRIYRAGIKGVYQLESPLR